MSIESFKDLIVWVKSISLVKEIYKCTALLPNHEMFGLVSQMRRSSVAIASNIAEGTKRGTRKDYVQFLRIASGSAAELETQLIVAQEVYTELNLGKSFELLNEVQRMLQSMINKLLKPITYNLQPKS